MTRTRLWVQTPLIESTGLSKEAECRIFLKLDNLQPSGSFKSRGIGNYIIKKVQEAKPNDRDLHFYAVSAGNAGIACVRAACTLGYLATVVVPITAKPAIIATLLALGATEVIQHGTSVMEAEQFVKQKLFLEGDPSNIFVPPFDHAAIWDGNESIMDEINLQLPDDGKPNVIICSVGGGGLLNGIMQGLDRRGWDDVDVIAMETEGADCLNQAVAAGKLITLDKITSLAKSLGVKRVSARTFEYAKRPQVRSAVLSDSHAARGSLFIARHERMMVELTVGVSVAACREGRLAEILERPVARDEKVIIIVCGGNDISIDMLAGWGQKYALGT